MVAAHGVAIVTISVLGSFARGFTNLTDTFPMLIYQTLNPDLDTDRNYYKSLQVREFWNWEQAKNKLYKKFPKKKWIAKLASFTIIIQ